jgi:hypothetical protein
LYSAIVSSFALEQFGFPEPNSQLSPGFRDSLSSNYFTFGFLDWLEELV